MRLCLELHLKGLLLGVQIEVHVDVKSAHLTEKPDGQ